MRPITLFDRIMYVVTGVMLAAAVFFGVSHIVLGSPAKDQSRIETPQSIHLKSENVIEEVVKLQKAFNKMVAYIDAKEKKADDKGNVILAAVKSVSDNQANTGKKLSRLESLLKRKARPTRKRKARRKYCGPKCRARKRKRKASVTNWGNG